MQTFHESRGPKVARRIASPRLLVVDDEPAVRRIVGRLVQRFFPQLEVLEAGDGDAALDLIERNDHDIVAVLADVQMPSRDGFGLCWSLRHAAPYVTHRDLPVVLMSAVAHDDRALERAWRAGTAFLMPKPFSEAEFVRALAGATGLEPALAAAGPIERDHAALRRLPAASSAATRPSAPALPKLTPEEWVALREALHPGPVPQATPGLRSLGVTR